MGLTYKKQDDLDKILGEFASFPEDIIELPEEDEIIEQVTEKKDSKDSK
jgi:hypothetical protein